jgi:malonate-semialdehyde dehydrogenase (acetylating)/methylmalonate-semialdehyde dehydrogenase
VSPQERARAVLALRDTLVRNRQELTALVTADMGKTLADADGEVGRGIESVESAAAIPHLLKGETLEGVATGVDVELVRQPVGVVAAITPFNFPAMIPLWFLPYAVACGNTFLLKPSERDPRPAERICELIDEEEIFPPGVVNLIHGGREAVEAILDHEGIDAVSFVGQAATARLIATRSAQTGKRVQALGGAKNSMIVADDADLETAVPAIMGSAFGAAGQRCLAGSVCVIAGDEARQTEVREALGAAAEKLTTGPGADPGTDVCPMVAPEARERAEAAVATAESEGAKVLLDGRIGGGEAGAMLGPTLVDVTDPESELACEEVFGPVLTLVAVPDLDAAIEFANGSRYGNAGSIFTTSGSAARAYRWGIEAGMLGVNIGVPAPVAWFPFSGWKDSIDGDLHANGRDAVDFYTRKKVITSRW